MPSKPLYDYEKFVSLYRDHGMRIADIERETGASSRTIRNALEKMGVERRKGPGRRVNAEKVAEGYVEYGYSVPRLAHQFHCSEMTIYRALTDQGVELRLGSMDEVVGPLCRNGHSRMLWGHKNSDGRWRCRKCQGRKGFVYVLLKGDKLISVHSTPDRAKTAANRYIRTDHLAHYWTTIEDLTEWVYERFTVRRVELDG